MDYSSDPDFQQVCAALEEGRDEDAAAIARGRIADNAAWAHGCLGSLYQCGLGVEQSWTLAEHHLRAAALQDNALAWWNLSVLYAVGDETHLPDEEQARKCRLQAKRCGFDLIDLTRIAEDGSLR